MSRILTLLGATTLGLTLAAAPFAIGPNITAFAPNAAMAKDHGGDHGGKGGGHGGDKSSGHSAEAHAASGSDKSDDRSGDDVKGVGAESDDMSLAHRQDSKDQPLGDDQSDEHSVGEASLDADAAPAPAQLGRLNGFLHASEEARLNASTHSAVGMISQSYADALGDYVDARGRIGSDPDAVREARQALDRAAAILGAAANKPLSPQIVAAINAEVAPGDVFTDRELRIISNKANRE